MWRNPCLACVKGAFIYKILITTNIISECNANVLCGDDQCGENNFCVCTTEVTRKCIVNECLTFSLSHATVLPNLEQYATNAVITITCDTNYYFQSDKDAATLTSVCTDTNSWDPSSAPCVGKRDLQTFYLDTYLCTAKHIYSAPNFPGLYTFP